MQIKLDFLVYGTEFSFESKRYIKGNGMWVPSSIKIAKAYENQSIISDDCVGKACWACHQFMGGKVQTRMTTWFRTDTIVSVD